jgi:nucleoside-diphosphate-sugar epimerase
MARVIVTGGSGKAGHACIEELLRHGYEVFNLDTTPPAKAGIKNLVWVDLTRNCSLKFYPGVPLKKKVGQNETLQSIDKARRVLGYDPQYSWRTGASN